MPQRRKKSKQGSSSSVSNESSTGNTEPCSSKTMQANKNDVLHEEERTFISDPERTAVKCAYCKLWSGCSKYTPIAFIVGAIIGCTMGIFYEKHTTWCQANSAVLSHPSNLTVLSCPDDWIGYQRKCYYFSEAEGNWTEGQSNCSAFGASLAVVDTLQDLSFMLRHKCNTDPWIGLRKESGRVWKWSNGTKFNKLFAISGDADCAYLISNRISALQGAGSSRCYTKRAWICSKPQDGSGHDTEITLNVQQA